MAWLGPTGSMDIAVGTFLKRGDPATHGLGGTALIGTKSSRRNLRTCGKDFWDDEYQNPYNYGHKQDEEPPNI